MVAAELVLIVIALLLDPVTDTVPTLPVPQSITIDAVMLNEP
jgi:hypothetical protein